MKNENKASKIRAGKDRRKKGVSPVIGVILMVAATIVIAAVVLAMLGGFQAPKQQYLVTATASADIPGTTLYVTYHGGPDANVVDAVTGEINGVPIVAPSGWGTVDSLATDVVVGATGSGLGTVGAGNDHVTAAATFLDGSSQVILDTWV
jgi:flagellin-like protein